jgi:hypothetical protein
VADIARLVEQAAGKSASAAPEPMLMEKPVATS